MIRIYSILLILIQLFLNDLNSQHLVDFKHLTIEDGLTDRMVNHVIRDSFGFFYIISETSIQRYDGEKFEDVDISVLIESKTKPGLVTKFSLSPRGKLVLSIPNISKLFYISPGELYVGSIKLPIIGQIQTDEKNWFIIEDKGITHAIHTYDIETSKLSFIADCSFIPNQIIKFENDIYLTDSLGIYIIENGIKKIDSQTGLLVRAGNNLIKHQESTLYKWNGGSFKPIYQQNNKSLKFRFSQSDNRGNLMIAYGEIPRYIDALIVLDHSGKVHTINDIPKIDNIFKDIYADNAFTEIMTVGYDGVHIFRYLKEGAIHKHKRAVSKETFGYIISGIAIDDKDQILYCTESKGMYKLNHPIDSSEFLFEQYNGGNQGFHQNGKLYFAKENGLFYSWSYTFDNKSILHLIDLKQNKAKPHNIPQKINDQLFINKTELLIGGYNLKDNSGLLSVFNIESGLYKQVFKTSTRIYSLQFRKKAKQYWIGTMEGLFVLDESFKILSKFSRFEKDPTKLLNHDYIRTTSDYGQNVVVGTVGGGIYIIDPLQFKILTHIDKSIGLTDNNAIGIVEDDNNNCWISTWNGLNVIDSTFTIIKQFYQQDYLPNKEFNTKAVTKDKRGYLYFGTINGMLILDPLKALSWASSAGLYVNNITGYESNSSQILDGNIGKNSFDSILIKVLTPDYYKYPFGKDQISAYTSKKDKLNIKSYNHTISLTQLEAAPKQKITIINNGSGRKISVPLVIKYNYLNLLKILGLLTVLGLILYIIILRQKQKVQELDKTNKKIAALELSALQSQMNPHFMFNAIGAIQYYIQTHDVEKADGYLSDFAMLMRNILESSKSKFITIRKELEIINLYIRLENIRYDQEFDYEINIDKAVELETLIPPMIIQPLVENAIVHGLSPLTERKGKLSIDINISDSDYMSFSVMDNGIGRAAAAKNKSLNHKSRGMQIIKDRVDAYDHLSEIAVEFTMEDIIKENLPMGTKAILKVKELD